VTAIDEEEEEGTDEDIPSAMLSSEAERILENAKKRLTVRNGRPQIHFYW
jgi:hypothetical protein